VYIQWIQHPVFKEKNLTLEHVKTSVGEYAVAVGQAILAPRPRHGSPEWQEQMAALCSLLPLQFLGE
jgi:hypothetical protein